MTFIITTLQYFSQPFWDKWNSQSLIINFISIQMELNFVLNFHYISNCNFPVPTLTLITMIVLTILVQPSTRFDSNELSFFREILINTYADLSCSLDDLILPDSSWHPFIEKDIICSRFIDLNFWNILQFLFLWKKSLIFITQQQMWQ